MMETGLFMLSKTLHFHFSANTKNTIIQMLEQKGGKLQDIVSTMLDEITKCKKKLEVLDQTRPNFKSLAPKLTLFTKNQ